MDKCVLFYERKQTIYGWFCLFGGDCRFVDWVCCVYDEDR